MERTLTCSHQTSHPSPTDLPGLGAGLLFLSLKETEEKGTQIILKTCELCYWEVDDR